MNLIEIVSEMLSRKVTEEEAKVFSLNQFGAIMSYIRKKDIDRSGIHRINIVEVATELAHQTLCRVYEDKASVMYVETEDSVEYSAEAQKDFDSYYDNYYSMIQDLTI